ncbi:SdiA-regulated domain-containing protein [Falsihalocynthiibacter sp. SS001]|uniref:SdiA-regulated domain-containing protein n=1 Tax=Falsihalocynthiibacter sp. SS001 TaxID=3349698 RepID=UPI0036D2D32A
MTTQNTRSYLTKWKKSVMLAVIAFCVVAQLAMAQDNSTLRFIEKHKIYDGSNGFKEPSGLAFRAGELLSVSDNAGAIYTLDAEGSINEKASFEIPAKDLEGITLLDDDIALVVEEERTRVLTVNLVKRRVIAETSLSDMTGADRVAALRTNTPKNKSLEGITVDRSNGVIYVVTEAEPRLLLSIAPDLSEIMDIWLLSEQVGFSVEGIEDSALDVSGITVSPSTGNLWIVSDQARTLFEFNLTNSKTKSYPLKYQNHGKTYQIKHAEGIAIDPEERRIYIVNDDGKDSHLYGFALPTSP